MPLGRNLRRKNNSGKEVSGCISKTARTVRIGQTSLGRASSHNKRSPLLVESATFHCLLNQGACPVTVLMQPYHAILAKRKLRLKNGEQREEKHFFKLVKLLWLGREMTNHHVSRCYKADVALVYWKTRGGTCSFKRFV